MCPCTHAYIIIHVHCKHKPNTTYKFKATEYAYMSTYTKCSHTHMHAWKKPLLLSSNSITTLDSLQHGVRGTKSPIYLYIYIYREREREVHDIACRPV